MKDIYYVYSLRRNCFIAVKGKPVSIEGITGDFFLHEGIEEHSVYFCVSEGKTGAQIAQGAKKKDAIAEAARKLKAAGQCRIDLGIVRQCRVIGISPRYFDSISQIAQSETARELEGKE